MTRRVDRQLLTLLTLVSASPVCAQQGAAPTPQDFAPIGSRWFAPGRGVGDEEVEKATSFTQRAPFGSDSGPAPGVWGKGRAPDSATAGACALPPE